MYAGLRDPLPTWGQTKWLSYGNYAKVPGSGPLFAPVRATPALLPSWVPSVLK